MRPTVKCYSIIVAYTQLDSHMRRTKHDISLLAQPPAHHKVSFSHFYPQPAWPLHRTIATNLPDSMDLRCFHTSAPLILVKARLDAFPILQPRILVVERMVFISINLCRVKSNLHLPICSKVRILTSNFKTGQLWSSNSRKSSTFNLLGGFAGEQ